MKPFNSVFQVVVTVWYFERYLLMSKLGYLG